MKRSTSSGYKNNIFQYAPQCICTNATKRCLSFKNCTVHTAFRVPLLILDYFPLQVPSYIFFNVRTVYPSSWKKTIFLQTFLEGKELVAILFKSLSWYRTGLIKSLTCVHCITNIARSCLVSVSEFNHVHYGSEHKASHSAGRAELKLFTTRRFYWTIRKIVPLTKNATVPSTVRISAQIETGVSIFCSWFSEYCCGPSKPTLL